jgi:hypothetical protein
MAWHPLGPFGQRDTGPPARPDRLFVAGVAALLLLPQLFAAPAATGPFHLGLPRVYSGDEVHYLVLLNSVLNDGDLDLSNNYASVHEGSEQAGLLCSQGRVLDHHSMWREGGTRYDWQALHNWWLPGGWRRDAAGRVHPVPKPGAHVAAAGHPEYPTHAPGIAFLLAPLLAGLRGTTYLEPAAVLCSGLAVLAALFFFRMLAAPHATGRTALRVATAAAFLGTPVWFYGRALLTEPYLLCFALGAYALYLRKGKAFAAGCLVGLGMQMKCYFLLLLLPPAADALYRKDWRAVLRMGLPAAVSAGTVLWLNHRLYGGWRNTSQALEADSLWHGLVGTLFSAGHGLLPYAPALLVAALCWPAFWRGRPRESLILLGGFAPYLLFHAAYARCGGGAFGPRYVVPVLPLLLVPLARVTELGAFATARGRVRVAGVLLLSILINAMGAVPYWGYWNRHPLLHELRATFWDY